MKEAAMSNYRRTPVKAPRVGGKALVALCTLLESPLGTGFVHKVRRDSGFDAFMTNKTHLSPHVPPMTHPAAVAPVSPRDEVRAASGGAAQLQAAYSRGVSPVDVLADVHVRAHKAQQDLCGYFIARDPQLHLRDAEASAARHKQGKALGPLDGVPFIVKDEFDVAGYATTLGTKFLKQTQTHDATVVQRLRDAGALVVGKANMNEIGINPIGLNAHHGVCRNPHQRGHITGGSSSASAATVADGLAAFSLGADGGGSIRIPAALCGVVGLKATHGRISEHGVPPLCFTVGHAGPIGLTVEDVALVYRAIAGKDPADSATWQQPAPSPLSWRSDAKGVRVGVCTPYFEDADEAVVRACKQALQVLVEAGATVVEIPPPDLDSMLWSHSIIILSEMLHFNREHLAAHRTDYVCDSRINLRIAESFTAEHLLHAHAHRHRLCLELWRTFENVDVIVTPTTAMTAPAIPEHALPIGESNLEVVDALMRFIRLANLSGAPALSVPCGVDDKSLPIGFHLMGRPYEENLLLQLGRLVEQALPPKRAPGFRLVGA
jgi:Asp-tRNA(Asn)/Glu-tRNA(Gln) amidotransferase A subunit family amidase